MHKSFNLFMSKLKSAISYLKLSFFTYLNYRQRLYDWLIICFFNKLPFIIRNYHTFLFYYRYATLRLYEIVPEWLAVVIFIAVFYRLGVDLAIAFCVLLFRLELSFVMMQQFYKRHALLLPIYLPKVGTPPPNSRGMWSKAAKIAEEAMTSPYAKTIIAGAATISVWKGLDVYDTYKQESIVAA
jgi:hypothetical protein